MEVINWWFLLLLPILATLFLKIFIPYHLPPGNSSFLSLITVHLLRKPFVDLEPYIRSLHRKYGPIISLRFGTRLATFISDRSIAHEALIQKGAIFADRPPPLATTKILSSNQHSINSASYGATWKILRRNLTSEILHHSRVKSFSFTRKQALNVLVDRLQKSATPIRVIDHISYAMFYLLATMCFGDCLEEKKVEEIARVERQMILNGFRFNTLNILPRLTRVFQRKKWEKFLNIRREQVDVIIPLIRARRNGIRERDRDGSRAITYLDTLFDLELPEENRTLDENEMLTLCNEFLNAGTDTTATALQWILANLVQQQRIQEKLYAEIKEVVGEDDREAIEEEELGKMRYLKAVVLEGLRRHPPGHFVLPHAVTEDVVLGGYLVPKKGSVNFMVADIGWDSAVWENAMEFVPERFMGEEEVDLTGRKEIKMMPFGVGRRMCPGYNLALLHLEYFVANLVWRFQWKPVDGIGVDLTEKQEFTVVMNHPLVVDLVYRSKQH